MRRAFDGTYPITRDFGVYDPAYSSYPNSLHPGTDYGLPLRTPLVAGITGTLSSIDRDRTLKTGRGKEIIITSGMKTRKYCHLEEIVVHSGFVTEGQLVGYSGTTGYSSGPHLHDELLINGVYVPLETNLTEEDMITKEDLDILRIGHSEIGGWDLHESHAGLHDDKFLGWVGQDLKRFIREQWKAGELFRVQRTQQAKKITELGRALEIVQKENESLKAQLGESTKWQTLRTLLRELLGIK